MTVFLLRLIIPATLSAAMLPLIWHAWGLS